MKPPLRIVLALSTTLATAAVAQQVTPVWYEHLNGDQGVATRLPILRKNVGGHESNDGTATMISLGKLLPYDSWRMLLYVRENGIAEGSATPADAALAAQYPDRCLIWINATNGSPITMPGHTNPVAHVFGVIPIAITGQGSQYDFFSEWGLDDDGNIYSGHKNKLLRWAKTGVDQWATTPVCAWTEPTSGAKDCSGADLDGSETGDQNQSFRWREFRVEGKGTNTTLFCGGGTWRMGQQPQLFKTLDGTNLYPVAKLNNRDNGCSKTEYALGGQATRVVKYGLDGGHPNVQVAYTGHYPGTGYGARPNRYGGDADGGLRIITPYSYTPSDSIAIYDRYEAATNGLPKFNWEAAGKDGLPERVPAQDGDAWYDGNWSCAMDANGSLDYVVNYSMPSWNNQYPSYSGTNYHKPGWIAVHRLDGSISANSAWRMSCTEDDIKTPDEGNVGNTWGYTGDITLAPDTGAPANLKKATIYWSGGAYGFGVFTVQNVAASVAVQPPANITVLEDTPLSISATVNGSPNSYQWTKGGSPLDGTLTNADGSFHYANTVTEGVKKTTLSVAAAKSSDTGVYKLNISNPLGGDTGTINVNVTVLLDTNKPTLVSVAGLGTASPSYPSPNLVKVLFSKRMDPTTAADKTKYSIPGATIVGAYLQNTAIATSLGGDWKEVILETGGLTPGQGYDLTISGVKDQTASGNTINPVTARFVAAAPYKGVLDWSYYYVGSGGLANLYASPVYPAAPMTAGLVKSFDTLPITANGDLNNVPGFGALGDNYGDIVSGWITPTVTTNYNFFIRSDDASDLYLSSDANPLNANLIAQETGCCRAFQEPGDPATSGPQALTAGVSYFIKAVHSEGGGGDYVQVAWRMEGDTNAAASLLPISGAYLSAYAPPRFYPPTYNGSQVTISWTGTGTLLETTDVVNGPWTPVAGNPSSPYSFTPVGPKKYFRVKY